MPCLFLSEHDSEVSSLETPVLCRATAVIKARVSPLDQ